MKKIIMAFVVLCLVPVMAPAQEAQLPQDQEQIRLSFAPLVKKSAPAVVNIYAARRMRARSPFGDAPLPQDCNPH